jgi:hypothetical protein
VDFPPIAAQSVCTEAAALILGPTGSLTIRRTMSSLSHRRPTTRSLRYRSAPNGNLLTANGDAVNDVPTQPSEIVEFTTTGRFVRQFNVDAAEGGAFEIGLASLSKLVRFAFVDDNAVNLTVTDRKSPDLPDD